MNKTVVLAVLAAMLVVHFCAAGPLWTVGTGAPNNSFYAVTYSNGLYVAVGESGLLITSPDGHSWTAPSSGNYLGTANSLNAIAYGNGEFVAVGDHGWTVTSPDGIHWTSASSGRTVNALHGIVFAAGQFVAVADNGTIITSANGASWAAASYDASVTDTNDNLSSITYANGKFVVVGSDGNTTFISASGSTWTQGGNGLGSSYMNGVAYGNGLFVSAGYSGGVYTSPDGTNWTGRAMTGTVLSALAFGNGLFLTVGNGGIMYFSGGANFWTPIQSGTSANLNGMVYGNGLFVVVGDGGTILSSTLSSVNPTPPQMNWALAGYAPSVTDTSDSLSSITYANGKFVVVGSDNNTTFSSTNGISWTQGGNGPDSSYMNGVAYGNGEFAAVNYGGSIYTSTDGNNWTLQTTTGTQLNGVAWFGGQYVAVGAVGTTDGVVYTSPNATQWTLVDSGQPYNLNAITVGKGGNFGLVAVGDGGTIISSANLGANWTKRTSGTVNSLYGITYGNGHYVAVGDSGTILASTDGLSWIQPTNYLTTANKLYAVTYGNGLFVAVGQQGWTVASLDATNWTSVSSATVNDLHAITYAGGVFVAVGDNGTILNSVVPKLGPVVLLPGGSLQVAVTGGPAQSCQILYSTDLINWTFLKTASLNTSGVGQFTDSTASSPRFYRALAVAP